jgi:hypothetical protein
MIYDRVHDHLSRTGGVQAGTEGNRENRHEMGGKTGFLGKTGAKWGFSEVF